MFTFCIDSALKVHYNENTDKGCEKEVIHLDAPFQINLAAARVNAGMTQEYVSEKLEISRATLAKWESGKSRPSTIMLNALCELYKISVDYIFLQ